METKKELDKLSRDLNARIESESQLGDRVKDLVRQMNAE